MNKVEKVIKEIFSPLVLDSEKNFEPFKLRPTYNNLKEVAKLISENAPEEKFQRYFSKNPNFLFRNTPASDDAFMGMIAKPKIGNDFIGDFAIFTVGQGGPRITLIELETPNDKLFTRKLTPSSDLQTALGQITDWTEWINANKVSFIKNCVEKLKQSPKYPLQGTTGSFKIGSSESINKIWGNFGGDDYCGIYTLLFIGRWSKLTDREQKRLLFLNSHAPNYSYRIKTFDQLIRMAFDDQFRHY